MSNHSVTSRGEGVGEQKREWGEKGGWKWLGWGTHCTDAASQLCIPDTYEYVILLTGVTQ